MPELFIANTSKQHHDFLFVNPKFKGQNQGPPRPVHIRIGTQVSLGDFSLEHIQDIVKQHERYGLKNVADLKRARDYVGICYSVGKPVNFQSDDVGETFEKNDDVLNSQAAERREDHANAIATQIQEKMSEMGVDVPRTEVSVTEDAKGGAPQVAEGYEVLAPGVESRRGGKTSKRAK